MNSWKKGRIYEDKTAAMYGKRQPMSGALPQAKEDVLGAGKFLDFLFQTKNHSGKKSYTLKLEDLKTLKRNASMVGRVGVFVINYGERRRIRYPKKRGF